MTYVDPDFVARQYEDAGNVEVRISLHQRFGVNREPWQRWVFDGFELPPDAGVLELGCGPGRLWVENLDLIPEGWSVTLTDASPGMVGEARGKLGDSGRFRFQVADAMELPFEGGSFDAVVANHMLYHVPDREKVFSEIARVLGPGGALYATTNGQNAHREMGWMQRILDPSHPDEDIFLSPLAFSLENGAGQLTRWFSDVSLCRYEDALVVTEVEPLVDYLLSGRASDIARETAADEFGRRISLLQERLERELAERGGIRISKDSGMFVARR